MAKLIITDFDKTLIKDNSERNFIFFLLVHCIELRLHVFLNLVSHLLLKIYFRVINKPLNYKIFYKNLPFKFLSKQVELFVLNQSSSFLLNDTIMRNIDKDKDSILILTKSPSFLSSGLCKLLLNDYSWFLKGTDLELKNGFFTGLIIDKLTSSRKKEYCKRALSSRAQRFDKVVGYGDSYTDKEFLSLLEESYIFDKKLADLSTPYKKSIWRKPIL